MKTTYHKIYPMKEKAYKIDLNLIDEGFLLEDIVVYAHCRSKAKVAMLKKLKTESISELKSGEAISFLNVPIVRSYMNDKLLFEGKIYTVSVLSDLIHCRERKKMLESILSNESITHCYILRHNSYYRPNYAGYTDKKLYAGLYPKSEAVSHARSVDDVVLEISTAKDHNDLILAEISKLENLFIYDDL